MNEAKTRNKSIENIRRLRNLTGLRDLFSLSRFNNNFRGVLREGMILLNLICGLWGVWYIVYGTKLLICQNFRKKSENIQCE